MINRHKLFDINSRSAGKIKSEGRNMEKARAIFLPSRGYMVKNPRGHISLINKSSKSPVDGTGLLSRA